MESGKYRAVLDAYNAIVAGKASYGETLRILERLYDTAHAEGKEDA
jgi:hypothetical protein